MGPSGIWHLARRPRALTCRTGRARANPARRTSARNNDHDQRGFSLHFSGSAHLGVGVGGSLGAPAAAAAAVALRLWLWAWPHWPCPLAVAVKKEARITRHRDCRRLLTTAEVSSVPVPVPVSCREEDGPLLGLHDAVHGARIGVLRAARGAGRGGDVRRDHGDVRVPPASQGRTLRSRGTSASSRTEWSWPSRRSRRPRRSWRCS